MKKIGVIGLGIMGKPMARHLLNAGYELYVYNRTASKAESLVKSGARLCNNPAEVAKHCEAILIMLKADAEVETALTGTNGIIEGAQPGLIIMNSSTISPHTSIRLAKQVAGKGITMLDSPVTGSGIQAQEAKLTFMVGGDKKAFEQCLPLFNTMGQQAFYMGESGTGSYMKLANNALVATNLLSLAEALTMACKSGVDPEVFVQVVNGGGARSAVTESRVPKIINRDFTPAFGTVMLYKDLGLIYDLSKELSLPMPVMAVVREMIHTAVAKGYGEQDICSIIKHYEELAGIEIKK
ncbi:NAD(P)-dependent oxidoreductase [Sporomusa acidovorans]|uniref:2-hydroxy-3-oxopropionate reductase n=1 Tax=Sporomusa acidovorans (strain ATCC 49682 / DSM 3132 / Mol) TaxID=1123286 RepID=A0ABZ3J245_SPOA4|nr:NAD(P)-dependent oxidoreductase [Sporomusa acidovorans]OZC19951.1 2-hydroxy-3-oxopropionate reductase [Sporomusa acidovorans DSM 3132]SDD49201.1 tartronate semialdehyde reductase [Sporomusa acidovorans]